MAQEARACRVDFDAGMSLRGKPNEREKRGPMPIIRASDELIRSEFKRYLQTQRAENPQYRVLEIGAAYNPQFDDLVDTYMDIRPVRSNHPTLLGDINLPEVWEKTQNQIWDFVICTHVLEDIRDPAFVLVQMMRHARAGFIAVPNKHTEFASVESWFYPGYSHHRWIFTVQNQKLRFIAKWPMINYFARINAPFRWAAHVPGLSRLVTRCGFIPGRSRLPWFDPKKVYDQSQARGLLELSVLWEKDIPFEIVGHDYPGDSCQEQVQLYLDELAGGL